MRSSGTGRDFSQQRYFSILVLQFFHYLQYFQTMSSDEELPDIPHCPIPAKKLRSSEEDVFLDLQKRYHELLDIPANQHSDAEKKETNKLMKKYSKLKTKFPHLAEKRPTSTDAECKAKSIQNMSEESMENIRTAARERMARPINLEANRVRMAEQRNLEANRVRMAEEKNLEAHRVRRAEERNRVKIPRTYMDARRITDIFSGKQIVPELKDTKDAIGWLGDHTCPGCKALHWSRETSQTCCGWRCPCSNKKFDCGCELMCKNEPKRVNGTSCCGLKVSLPPFRTPPEGLRKLWFEDSHEAKLFRENSRSFNNAMALSSIKVRELNTY